MIFDKLLNAFLGESGHLTMDEALRKILDANESTTAQELLAAISVELRVLCETDYEYGEWNRWLGALWNAFGNRQFKVAQVADRLNENVVLLRMLPISLQDARRDGISFNRSLGRALARHDGHVTASGLVQQRISSREPNKHGHRWCIRDLGRQEVLDWFPERQLKDRTGWWESSKL